MVSLRAFEYGRDSYGSSEAFLCRYRTKEASRRSTTSRIIPQMTLIAMIAVWLIVAPFVAQLLILAQSPPSATAAALDVVVQEVVEVGGGGGGTQVGHLGATVGNET